MENLRLRHWESAVLIGTLALCAVLRLWPLQFDYFHPDEVIAVEVARHVVDTGSLDTNWKNAALPIDFKLPQYNFSGYIMSAAVVDRIAKVFAGPGRDTLAALRLWSALLSVAAAGLAFVVGRSLFGVGAGLIAGLLVTLNPLLVQDALYARPEPFVTVLTLLVLWGTQGQASGQRIFLSALAAGGLVATKISMVGLLPLLFLPDALPQARFWPGFLAYIKQMLRTLPRRAGVAVPGVAIGFVIGAPFVLANTGDYWTGIEFLLRQYGGPQWPFGLGEATVPERLVYVGQYFGATTGALILALGLAGALWAGAAQNFRALAVYALALLFAIRFATYPAFFERNLSHLIPIFLIFAAVGIMRFSSLAAAGKPWLRPAALAVLLGVALIPAVRTTALLADEFSGNARKELNHLRAEMVGAYGLEATVFGGEQDYAALNDESFPRCSPWLLEVVHFHSARSDASLLRVSAQTGFREVGRYASKFNYVPTASLHTYTTPTIVFLFRDLDPAGCEADANVIDPRAVGAPLELIERTADPAWTERGAYPAERPFTSGGYFGSWSGADANTGVMRMTVRVDGRDEIAVPYITGPSPLGQSLRVTDKFSGAEIWKMDPLKKSAQWRFQRIRLPPRTREIVVEAVDAGADGGQWHAVDTPRGLGK